MLCVNHRNLQLQDHIVPWVMVIIWKRLPNLVRPVNQRVQDDKKNLSLVRSPNKPPTVNQPDLRNLSGTPDNRTGIERGYRCWCSGMWIRERTHQCLQLDYQAPGFFPSRHKWWRSCGTRIRHESPVFGSIHYSYKAGWADPGNIQLAADQHTKTVWGETKLDPTGILLRPLDTITWKKCLLRSVQGNDSLTLVWSTRVDWTRTLTLRNFTLHKCTLVDGRRQNSVYKWHPQIWNKGVNSRTCLQKHPNRSDRQHEVGQRPRLVFCWSY